MRIEDLQESPDREYVNLPKEDIERLREKFLPDWEYKDNSLQKRYKFEDYFEVIEFLINTIKPQEKLDHHADLGVFYDEVLVKIYTHRTNDVTDYDFMVALQMDMIAKMKHGAINPNYDLNALVDEGTRCWKGYMRKGFKTMFGKRVPNCVKREGKFYVNDAFGEIVFESATRESALNFLRQNYLELKACAIHARQIAKQYECAVLYMSQLSAEAEGKIVLNQSMMEGSRTGKAAEADLMILIAKNPPVEGQDEEDAQRHLNIVKNKLSGWHGNVHCELDYKTARYIA